MSCPMPHQVGVDAGGRHGHGAAVEGLDPGQHRLLLGRDALQAARHRLRCCQQHPVLLGAQPQSVLGSLMPGSWTYGKHFREHPPTTEALYVVSRRPEQGRQRKMGGTEIGQLIGCNSDCQVRTRLTPGERKSEPHFALGCGRSGARARPRVSRPTRDSRRGRV